MITRGLSCDRVEFGHFVGGQMTPLTPPWQRACTPKQSDISLYPQFNVFHDYKLQDTELCFFPLSRACS